MHQRHLFFRQAGITLLSGSLQQQRGLQTTCRQLLDGFVAAVWRIEHCHVGCLYPKRKCRAGNLIAWEVRFTKHVSFDELTNLTRASKLVFFPEYKLELPVALEAPLSLWRRKCLRSSTSSKIFKKKKMPWHNQDNVIIGSHLLWDFWWKVTLLLVGV